MIELPDGNIAVSSCVSPHPIVIINPTNYSIIKEIKDQEYITTNSALCLFDAYSFIYVRDGKFLQISNNNEYEILFKTKSEEQLYGWGGMINIENGKYLKSTNENIIKFRDYLNEKGIVATIRRELGSDIDAACGQLRKKEVEKCEPTQKPI